MRIYTRFAWLTLAITLVALGSATMLWNASLQDERRQELDERLLDHARILASELSDPRDRARMNALVRRINHEIRSRLTVIDKDGTVLAESNLEPDEVAAMENHLLRPEVQDALARGIGRAVRESPTLGIPMAYVAIRWGPSAAPFGVVRAALPMTRVVEEQNRGRGRLLLVVLASLILAGVLGTVAARRFSRPLAELSDGARRIAGGDFGRRLEVAGSAETRELALSINHLAASVQSEISELDRERERVVRLLQGLPDGILVLDRDGRITLANRLARELLALDHDYEGKTPVEAVRSAELQQAVDRATESGKAEVVEIELAEPERRILSLGMVRLETGLVIVFHDVTRLRRLEEARREMVANIGHELRTPLAAILGYLETLEHGGELPPEDRNHFLGIIARNSRRLERLVQDLSRLSKLESSHEQPRLTPVRLADVVSSATETLDPRARKKEVTVTSELAEGLPAALADRHGLETVVLNLLDNAIRVTPEGSAIEIRAWAEDDGIQVSIRDHGPGIPRDLRERVFERFYRMDPGRTADEGGSGLGLAIVKHTILQFGGSVDVMDAPGGGALVRFTLPAAAGDT